MDDTGTRAGGPPIEGGAETPVRAKRIRGFAAMPPERQRAIAAKGGRASHVAGLRSDGTGPRKPGHTWDSEAARAAGKRGGRASRGGRGKLPT